MLYNMPEHSSPNPLGMQVAQQDVLRKPHQMRTLAKDALAGKDTPGGAFMQSCPRPLLCAAGHHTSILVWLGYGYWTVWKCHRAAMLI